MINLTYTNQTAKKVYLQITPFFPSLDSFRGSYILDQVKALKKHSDYEVIVIRLVSFFERNISKVYEFDGINVYTFKVLDLPSSTLPGIFSVLNRYRFNRFLLNVVGIDFNQLDVAHCHVAYPAGFLGNQLKQNCTLDVYVQHHGFDVAQFDVGRIKNQLWTSLNNKYKKKIFLETVNNCELNICVSRALLTKLYLIDGVDVKKDFVLYNGIDTNKFYKMDKRVDNHVFTIGCIANFWDIKDQMTLLKATNELIKKNSNVKVIFIGTGPTLESCKFFVRENGLSDIVEFREEIAHSKLNDFYNQLNLFVLPSYYEAFGCVYTEALQVGVPIIAVKNQGIEEVLHEHDKAAFLIEKSDHMQLVDLIYQAQRKKFEVNYDFNINHYIKRFLSFVGKCS